MPPWSPKRPWVAKEILGSSETNRDLEETVGERPEETKGDQMRHQEAKGGEVKLEEAKDTSGDQMRAIGSDWDLRKPKETNGDQHRPKETDLQRAMGRLEAK